MRARLHQEPIQLHMCLISYERHHRQVIEYTDPELLKLFEEVGA